MTLRKFVIGRDIPTVGSFEREQLRGAAAKSNEVLRQLGADIQWVESYVAADKTFCVYLAKDEAIIRKHEQMSGFPATTVTEVRKMIDPTTDEPIIPRLPASPPLLSEVSVSSEINEPATGCYKRSAPMRLRWRRSLMATLAPSCPSI